MKNFLVGEHAASSRCERGASLVEFGFLLPTLVLLVLGVIDFGRGYYLSIEVANAARAGAAYGAQNGGTWTDVANMKTAATNDVDLRDASLITATAVWGCECSDGTSVTQSCGTPPTCAISVVNYVQVTTNATYTTLFKWPGVPNSIALQGQSKMRVGQY